jgi:hypothetical protein
MTPEQWQQVLRHLNASWPTQQVEGLTADQWYRDLGSYPGGEVMAALEAHRTNTTPGRDGLPLGHWAPASADLLAYIREQRRREAVTASTSGAMPASGVPMPPETKEAIEVLKRTKLPPSHNDHLPGANGSFRIEQLAGYLEARLAEEHEDTPARREDVADARRTCGRCATSEVGGWLQGTGGWLPCPACRPGRHQTWVATRRSGWPDVAGTRNLMALDTDRATGEPKHRSR